MTLQVGHFVGNDAGMVPHENFFSGLWRLLVKEAASNP